jgi:hypothetical protein
MGLAAHAIILEAAEQLENVRKKNSDERKTKEGRKKG